MERQRNRPQRKQGRCNRPGVGLGYPSFGGNDMTPEEQNLISSLFERLRKADTATKDPEAERFIRQKVEEFSAAPYLLVQSVLVLEHAVANAQARITELEKQLAAANQNQKPSHGGFLSGLFGGGRQHEETPPPAPQNQPAPGRP